MMKMVNPKEKTVRKKSLNQGAWEEVVAVHKALAVSVLGDDAHETKSCYHAHDWNSKTNVHWSSKDVQ